MKKILTLGSVTADILVNTVDQFPSPGILQGIDNVKILPGGCAVNAAIDIKKLGGDIALSCLIGDDALGKMLLNYFKNIDLTCEGIVVDPTVETTVSIVLINSFGERSFLYNPGSSAEFGIKHINIELIKKSDIIFVAGQMLLPSFEGDDLADFFKQMKSLGKYTVMDTAWDKDGKWLSRIEKALPYTDLFMPSKEEAIIMSGQKDPEKIADFFFEKGCKSVIIKLGSAGSLVCENYDNRFYQPIIKGTAVVDSTGAGDSYCSGFLFGLARNWNFNKCAEFASCVASCCIEKKGASEGILSFEKTLSRLGFTSEEEFLNT